jgi:hypothetical protein
VVRELEAQGRTGARWPRCRGVVPPGGADELRHAARACAGACLRCSCCRRTGCACVNPAQALQDAAHAAVHTPGGGAPGGRACRASCPPAARDAFQVSCTRCWRAAWPAGPRGAEGPALRRAMEDAWLHARW